MIKHIKKLQRYIITALFTLQYVEFSVKEQTKWL